MVFAPHLSPSQTEYSMTKSRIDMDQAIEDATGGVPASDDKGIRQAPRGLDQSPRFAPPTKEEQEAAFFGEIEKGAHPLDEAPINSKIVVVKNEKSNTRYAVLATPESQLPLPEGDVAHRLPVASKIYKVADAKFQAVIPAPYDYANGTDTSAEALIARVHDLIVNPPKPKDE